MNNLFDPGTNCIAIEVTRRHFGQQNYGISPKGANDSLAFATAHIMLGEPHQFKCTEIIYPLQTITFNEEVIFCLSGAVFTEIHLDSIRINHATVYRANPGSKLKLTGQKKGFRTYLFATKLMQANQSRIGLERGRFDTWFTPYSNQLYIIKGPEHSYLQSKFTFIPWSISTDSNQMGIRLTGNKIELTHYDIVSSAVTDGTIQATKNGPVVLMRHRQTTGGYPRIFQVTEISLNHLAQIDFRRIVKFNLTSREQAIAELQQQLYALAKFRQEFI